MVIDKTGTSQPRKKNPNHFLHYERDGRQHEVTLDCTYLSIIFAQRLQKTSVTYRHPGGLMEMKHQMSWKGPNPSSDFHRNCPVPSQHHADPLLERGDPDFSDEDTFLNPGLTSYTVSHFSSHSHLPLKSSTKPQTTFVGLRPDSSFRAKAAYSCCHTHVGCVQTSHPEGWKIPVLGPKPCLMLH